MLARKTKQRRNCRPRLNDAHATSIVVALEGDRRENLKLAVSRSQFFSNCMRPSNLRIDCHRAMHARVFTFALLKIGR